MREFCKLLNIDNVRMRVAEGLDEDGFRLFGDGGGKRVFDVGIDKRRRNSVQRRGVRKVVVCAAVDGLGSDNMLALRGSA